MVQEEYIVRVARWLDEVAGVGGIRHVFTSSSSSLQQLAISQGHTASGLDCRALSAAARAH